MLHNSIYNKTFAAFWYFRDSLKNTDEFEIKSTFWANNFAARRDLLIKYPFPNIRPMFRMSCIFLAQKLRDAGTTIYRNNKAKVYHPPPNGINHFMVRALIEGHDSQMARKLFNHKTRYHKIPFPIKNCYRAARSIYQIIISRKAVNLAFIELPIAFSIAVSYQFFVCLGEFTAIINPKLINGNLRI